MPMIAQLPFNRYFAQKFGYYKKYINLLDRKETAVQRQVRRGGLASYEPDFQSALLALSQLNQGRLVFYDIGAHIGLYSLLLSKIFHQYNHSIHAFEPTASTANMACRIRDANNMLYQVNKYAIGSYEGFVNLYISNKAETSNSLNPSFRNATEVRKVKINTIDNYVKSGAPVPTIIKIDTETLEPEVLIGARKTIATHSPIITCELLPKKNLKDSIGEALSWINYHGYNLYQISSNKEYEQFSVKDAIDSLSSERRDWILSKFKLQNQFYTIKDQWRDAIDTCTQDTNKYYESGKFEYKLLLEEYT